MNSIALMRHWPARRWLAAAAAALGTAVFIGVPTRLIPTPLFSRAVPVTWWAWPTLVVTALLSGLVIATYVRLPGTEQGNDTTRMASVGGFLSFFAVGCPVCNKIVVLAIGVTGALKFFAPIQPILAIASLGLLGWSLRVRLRGEVACPVGSAGSA